MSLFLFTYMAYNSSSYWPCEPISVVALLVPVVLVPSLFFVSHSVSMVCQAHLWLPARPWLRHLFSVVSSFDWTVRPMLIVTGHLFDFHTCWPVYLLLSIDSNSLHLMRLLPIIVAIFSNTSGFVDSSIHPFFRFDIVRSWLIALANDPAFFLSVN